jgi:hypothetical protein
MDTKIQSLLESIANPGEFVKDFSVEVQIRILTPSGSEEGPVLQMAPFHTVEDILRALWVKENSSEYYPSYVFLATMTNEEESLYSPAMGSWFTDTEEVKDTIDLPNPFQLLQANQSLGQFVDAQGEKTPIAYTPRNRITLEDAFLKTHKTMPIFYVVTLGSLMRAYRGAVSSRSWYGQFYPYFPNINPSGPYEITPEEQASSKYVRKYIQCKLAQIEFLNNLTASVEPEPFTTTGFQHLTFSWKNTTQQFEGCDTLFYSADVNEVRPFMRLLSPTTTAMTKLFQPDPFKPPVIADESLLKQWVQERSPSVNDNFLFYKLRLRGKEPGILPLYGTVRVFDDGTSDFTIQPPKNMRVLTFQRDAQPIKVSTLLTLGLENTSFSPNDIQFTRGTIHLGLHLSQDVKKPTRAQLRERIDKISSIFQEIAPLSNESPFLMLRYKGVSNFVREDRIAMFLTHVSNRTKGIDSKLVQMLAQEFELSQGEAQKRVATWLSERGDFTVADPETRDYVTMNNPGTDIAIHAQHPYYTFHIYRLESLEDFRRIYTTLYLLFFLEDEFWEQGEACRMDEKVDQSPEMNVEESVSGNKENGEENQGQGQLPEFDFLESAVNFDLEGAEELGEGPEAEADAEGVADFEFTEEGAFNLESLSPAEEAAGVPESSSPANRDPSTLDPPRAEKPKRAFKKAMKEDTEQQTVVAESYFLTRLQRLDPTLFIYSKKNPADKAYTSQCAANWDRQPAVLDQGQFDRMWNIYKDDPDLALIVLGREQTDEDREQLAKKGTKEKFHILRYGSDRFNLNYYLCSEFFCILDVLPIKEADWNSVKDREGRTKPKGTCPFCKRTKIKNKSQPGANEAVIQRMIKPGTDPNDPKGPKVQKYIGFLKDGRHPAGFELPCCFTMEKKLKFTDPPFERFRASASVSASAPVAPPAPSATATPVLEAAQAAQAAQIEEDVEQDTNIILTKEEAQTRLRVEFKDYNALLYTVGKETIVDKEKYPLRPGVVGLCGPGLDVYFGQDSETFKEVGALQKRKKTMEMKDTTRGFFRVGVLNISKFLQRQSFFAAIAPLLKVNTVQQVIDIFDQKITEKVFMSLNFGNLLLEFFNPADRPPTPMEAAKFSKRFLTVNWKSRGEISRLYRSYYRFKEYLHDSYQVKQARHFIHALAEPGLITTRGINLIVLKYKGPVQTSQIEVKCPLLGYDATRYSQNDIGFITYSDEGIWEPLIYVHDPNVPNLYKVSQEGRFTLTNNEVSGKVEGFEIEPVVLRRIEEFKTRCASTYRGAFTLQSGVNPASLLPLSLAISLLPNTVGLVRDTYNHLIAITVSTNPENPKSGKEVLLPVADDGTLFPENYLKAREDTSALQIHINFKGINFASIEEVEQLYKEYIIPRVQEQTPMYSFIGPLGSSGFQIGHQSSIISLPIKEIESSSADRAQFEYYFNRSISDLDGTKKDTFFTNEFLLKRAEIENIYQHLRYTFSRWLEEGAGPEFKKELDELLLRNDLTKYEKIYRLHIELGAFIHSWLAPDEEPFSPPSTLLRQDCIKITDKGKCTGYCTWKLKDDSEKCLIHTPSTVQVSSNAKEVQDSTVFFTIRLLDEIVRLPTKRYELLNKGVSRIQVPTTDVRMGDQWIIPENTPAWSELLEGIEKPMEEPQYYEEMSRATPAPKIAKAVPRRVFKKPT